MHIAKQKRKENIVEFILYMYQVQDTIRALGLNKDYIESKLLTRYSLSKDDLLMVKEWYFGLVDQMKSEEKEKSGNIQSIQNILNDVNEFHLLLLTNPDYSKYQNDFEKIADLLSDYQLKVKKNYTNKIELAIDSVYSYIMLRMKNEMISDQTKAAIQEISKFLNLLAMNYRKHEQGIISII